MEVPPRVEEDLLRHFFGDVAAPSDAPVDVRVESAEVAPEEPGGRVPIAPEDARGQLPVRRIGPGRSHLRVLCP
jgi:hypothetical protein